MRVITGKYKGRHFDVPRSFKARPTTDFAKENVFNVLNSYVDWDEGPTALDLFSGTGSITLELLSRGCSQVVSVEKERLHHGFIKGFLEKLGDNNGIAICGDVFKYVSRCNEKFDIVFADPPYQLENLADLPDIVLDRGLIKEDGVFVLEHGKTNDFSNHPHFLEHRSWGSVNFSFFR